ncbi:YitT family protein [Rummeliibacillus sp. TYF005]|uniref:YitT family protein n=1 Tax=Rummeliibacillus sp. TYF005 TaxID=2058214 RepID=UPI000F52B868|nr:YitT family protein [Rummeliibacillus sp. TYF005]RPJ95302.1 hypothetical protein CW357_11165 [Rummeliibacillus sp. TYF005]
MFLFKKGLMVIIGSIFLSLGINLFLAPNRILDGGFIGLSLILNYLFNLKIGLMIVILSLPMFIVAWFKEKKYFYNSLHGLFISSFFIDYLRPLRYLLHLDILYSSIIGGIFVGLGTGLMLRFDISTCGTDLLALFLSKRFGINVGMIILLIDSFVISLGGLLISGGTFLFSIFTIAAGGITISLVNRHAAHA